MSLDFLNSLFGNLWAIFLIVVFFGGSIFVHELGHFLAARRRGVKVDRFSIGFGSPIWWKRGSDGVEYRVGWLPIGGYVLLPQLADLGALEGEPTTDAAQLPPVTYGTRVLVFVAGAFFNILFAFALACLLWASGQVAAEQELSTSIGRCQTSIEVDANRTVPGPAYAAGLRDGDRIVQIDGKNVNSFSDIERLVALGGGRGADQRPQVAVTYERAGQRTTVPVFPELVGPERLRDIGIDPAVKVMVTNVQPDSPAEVAGLKPRDIIEFLDGHPANYAGFVTEYLQRTAGRTVNLSIRRDDHPLVISVQPRRMLDPLSKKEVYRLGVLVGGAISLKTIHVPPWVQLADDALWTWRSFLSVLNPRSDIGLSKMSGPIGIAERVETFAKLDFRLVLAFVILVNVNLAIFNLLPIPVLDGGQILFATIGRLRGRALPVKFVAATQSIFVVLILAMMAYVTVFGDLRRILRDARADQAAPEPVAKPGPARP